MRDEFDAIDTMKTAGQVDLFAFMHGTLDRGVAAAAVEYKQRITSSWSAFGRAWVGRSWDETSSAFEVDAIGGVRWRF